MYVQANCEASTMFNKTQKNAACSNKKPSKPVVNIKFLTVNETKLQFGNVKASALYH